jgi:aryl-alcohol dehydrogenase-like predicted oxidoreductase
VQAHVRKLGQSDIEVTAIGLGCWQFSQGKGLVGSFWESLSIEQVTAILRAALEGGINWFDTAEAYGGGRSEELLAKGLKAVGKKPGDVVVATKWMPLLRTAGNLTRTIGDRLRCLDGFAIDLHQIHNPMSVSPIAAQMNAMADLVEAHKVRTVGVSNFNEARMRAAHAALGRRGIPLVSNQVRYNLMHRRIETNGVLRAAKQLGITLIAYSPLAQGVLTGKFHDQPGAIKSRPGPRKWMPAFGARGLERTRALIELLTTIARDHQATASQVALSWIIRFHGDTLVAIPGATREDQAREGAGAMGLELTRDELKRIDEASKQFL